MKKPAKTAAATSSSHRGPGQPPRTANPVRLAAFAAAIPVVCEVFGVAPDALVGRNAAVGPRNLAAFALRKLALGAVARLGRDLELPWHAMHGSDAPGPLRGAHKASLSSFVMQFTAWTGIDTDGNGTTGEPAGELARFARDRYRQVLRDVFARDRYRQVLRDVFDASAGQAGTAEPKPRRRANAAA